MKKIIFLFVLIFICNSYGVCKNIREMGQTYQLHFKYNYWNNPSNCITFEQTLSNNQQYMRPMKCGFENNITPGNIYMEYSTFGYFHHRNLLDSRDHILDSDMYGAISFNTNSADYFVLAYDEPNISKPLPDGTRVLFTFNITSAVKDSVIAITCSYTNLLFPIGLKK